MSQALNNPTGGSTHRDYGATSSVTPEVSFAATSSGNSGFSPTEVVSLNLNIGQIITEIHSSTKQLEKQLKLVGTSKDSSALREKIHNINRKTNASAQAASQYLHRLQMVVRHGDREQKLQLERLTNEFENVITKYTKQQKLISDASRKSYQIAVEAERDTDTTARSELLQQQRQEQATLERDHDMLIERERQVKLIETDILDINGIMTKLNTLVVEQREQVDNTETAIIETLHNVEEGNSELRKAATLRNRHRRRILILLVIAVIVGLIVTGIIIAKLR